MQQLIRGALQLSNAVIVENFVRSKKDEYIHFVEHLGNNVRFSDDNWVCDKLRRSPAENNSSFTLYFSKIPTQHREMVKCFSAICLIRGKAMATIKTQIAGLVRFFKFWSADYENAGLHICNEFAATGFARHLEEGCFAQSSNTVIWSAVNVFFSTMNEWEGKPLKNPFSISPFYEQRKFDDKYIPESVALQLDNVFKKDEIALYLRCAYWLLRLIPSRISEVLGMRIDCLKRYNGNYVIFIPSWKQNGGRREPIMRSIHLEETGIAGHLIDLIKKQQQVARQLQEYIPECNMGALFTYQETRECEQCKPPLYYLNLYHVPSNKTICRAFKRLCKKHNVTDSDAQIYDITTHQFRHNGITDRLAAGFTAAQIAEMTDHHGSAMIFEAYSHLNLFPETVIEKQRYVLQEENSQENKYVLFGGRILNMEEQLEKHLLRNLRAHKVRGGICSDITGCKSDMWNCLVCEFFVPDADQLDYYEEQVRLWQEKSVRFSNFPVIKGNAEKNAELYARVLKKLKAGQHTL